MRDVFGVAGFSDRFILRTSVLVSILITLANVGVELGWKLTFGQNLIATSHTYVYMGMQVTFALQPNETVMLILNFGVVERSLSWPLLRGPS